MNYPSIATIMTVGVDRDTAIKVRKVLKSTSVDAITETSSAALKYVRACYHRPPLHMVKLYAIDALIETHGVEGFQEKRLTVDYCNTGDSYAATICRVNGRYRVTSWGDLVEKQL